MSLHTQYIAGVQRALFYEIKQQESSFHFQPSRFASPLCPHFPASFRHPFSFLYAFFFTSTFLFTPLCPHFLPLPFFSRHLLSLNFLLFPFSHSPSSFCPHVQLLFSHSLAFFVPFCLLSMISFFQHISLYSLIHPLSLLLLGCAQHGRGVADNSRPVLPASTHS